VTYSCWHAMLVECMADILMLAAMLVECMCDILMLARYASGVYR